MRYTLSEIENSTKMLIKFSSYGFLKNLRFFEPFLYLFFLSNGLTYFQIGILISIREIFINVFEIPTGVIADLTGRRRSMFLAFISYMISFTIFYLGSSYLLFVPSMILFSLGETFRSGTHKSMIMEYLDREDQENKRVEYYGKTRAASRIGSALSAVLAGAIVYFSKDYNVIFLVTLIPYSIGAVLILTYPAELDGDISNTGLRDSWNHVISSFREVIYSKELRLMFFNSSVYDAFFRVSKDYLSPIIENLALSSSLLVFIEYEEERTAILVGIIYFFVYINGFVSSTKSSDLLKSIGNKSKTLNILFYLLSFVFIMVGVFINRNLMILSIIAFFFLFTLNNLRRPMVIGYLGDRIESKKRATLLSTESQMRSLFGIVIAPVLGYIADLMGLDSTFIFAGITLLLLGSVLSIR